MDFIKLPENSEKLLLDIIQTDNPVQMLGVRFEQASQREDDELRSMLRELHERGYINVHWADDVPYYLTLNNSARTYKKQLSEHETQKAVYSSQKKKVSPIIFISHRSTDKAIADMLLDFFSGTGIPRETVFCSSLPGNDINEKISGEVKAGLCIKGFYPIADLDSIEVPLVKLIDGNEIPYEEYKKNKAKRKERK